MAVIALTVRDKSPVGGGNTNQGGSTAPVPGIGERCSILTQWPPGPPHPINSSIMTLGDGRRVGLWCRREVPGGTGGLIRRRKRPV
jgi:hypothetical protein